MTLMIATAQVVKMSVIQNSPSRDYFRPEKKHNIVISTNMINKGFFNFPASSLLNVSHFIDTEKVFALQTYVTSRKNDV